MKILGSYSMNTQITLPCMNGFTLRAEGANLVIVTRKAEETVPISKIQSFSMKEPHGLSQGQIVFKTAQAATAGVSLGFGIGAALGAEKSFFFTKANLDTANELKAYITSYEANTAQSAGSDGPKVVSVVDEIRGLKGLLDDGIITQDEFDTKKRQLLNL